MCVTSHATPGGPQAYEYGRLTVKLPASARSADGSTREYRYRGYANGAELIAVANCVTPNSTRAIEGMHRFFRVPKVQQQPVRDTGARTMSTGDEPVTLEPIEATACPYGDPAAYPHCSPREPMELPVDEQQCNWWDGCGSGYTYSTGGYDTYTPVEQDGTCPRCGERGPSPDQLESIRKSIDRVQCESMRTVLRERLPFMQVFTQQSPLYADPNNPIKELGVHSNGVIYLWEGLWKADGRTLRSQSQFVETLVHEAAHAWWTYYQGYSDGRRTHHDDWKQTMAECGYPNAE